ncbi:MAG: ribonuclease P protein component [Ignavibacteriales bacterium]|nr:ribonuclease P protein component [Ignavibacteriales bacterium]
MKNHGLPRNEILRGSKSFGYLFNRGKRYEGNILRCFVTLNKIGNKVENNTLFGVKVSRTIKRSVDRNRIKRIVREAFRLNKKIISIDGSRKSSIQSILFYFPPQNLKLTTQLLNSIYEDVVELLLKIKNYNT